MRGFVPDRANQPLIGAPSLLAIMRAARVLFGNRASAGDIAVLAALRAFGRDKREATQGLLVEHTEIPHPTLSRIVTQLVDRGLVEARPDPFDRRRIRLQLSHNGQRAAEYLLGGKNL